ncbi:hypothetical protein ABKV19_009014 [Rosa sericea]
MTTSLITMLLRRVMLGSMASVVTALVARPAATITTLLYYSDVLPRNFDSRRLERLVRRDYLVRDNYFFHFLVNFLRCFW